MQGGGNQEKASKITPGQQRIPISKTQWIKDRKNRGKTEKRYCIAYRAYRYVAVDDMRQKGLGEHFVETMYKLTPDLADKCIQILGTK